MRNLVIVLGDQLDRTSAAFDAFDTERDLVWMGELPQESEHVWAHKARITLFLAAMRHFAASLEREALPVRYLRIGEHPYSSLTEALGAEISLLQPERLVVVEPGEHRVLTQLCGAAEQTGLPLDMRTDRHFLIEREEFEHWAQDRKTLRLDHFYRHMRLRTGMLMDGKKPVGGAWNFDRENRRSFGRAGPGTIRAPRSFPPDALTLEVMQDVELHYADHPGSLRSFDWPVTAAQAKQALKDFVTHRLAGFGPYQDACWTGEPYLYHSRLSAAMNLKLLSPRVVLQAAIDANERGVAPLASVEGFIRQVLGWREFVRGIYWRHMPEYLEQNRLRAQHPLPAFYWSGATEMRCLAEAITQTLDRGYAHHIQRLMVTGLFALLLGVDPRQVHAWYLAVYVDAVEWVELPNVFGMSQFADGGMMASKPYAASGKYIQRMSNYCAHCRFDPADSTGNTACPFTTLYWDFLMRHEARFRRHPRAGMQWRNLDRLTDEKRTSIRRRAEEIRAELRDREA